MSDNEIVIDQNVDVVTGEIIGSKYAFLALLENDRHPSSKLTMGVIEEICAGIEEGATLYECCRRVKIHPRTFQKWRKKGDQNLADKKAEINEYGILVEAMKMASGAFASNEIRKIKEHGFEDWRASAWLLERILPEEFGQHRTHSDPSKENSGTTITMRVQQELLDDL